MSYLYVEYYVKYINDLYIETIKVESNLEREFKSIQDSVVILEKDISEKIKESEKKN